MVELPDTLANVLKSRDDAITEFLRLLQNPFASQLSTSSIYAAIVSSFSITAAVALGFSLVRPLNTVVYAPKLKHADEKHAPPQLGKGIFSWIKPLWTTTEQDLVKLVGMDATIFMRFTRMCRNIFLSLAVLCCCIQIPINWYKNASPESPWLQRVTPMNVWGKWQWATVVMSWVTTLIVCFFLWWNYRKVCQLRIQYLRSEEYQQSLHARTLMLYDIPKNMTSDEGIARIIDSVAPSSSFSRTAVARDVKILPALIEQHGETVRKLERVLAKYLKDPKNLPPTRPVCRPSKKDPSFSTYPKDKKLDAIDYLTQRIKLLELEIKEVRQRIDKRGSMPYGFASYSDISEAHAIAYLCRSKKPQGARVTLAPRPNDIVWENMPLSSGSRAMRRLWNNLWITVLTVVWVAPNAMIAIFLVNLSNLALVWSTFQKSLEENRTFWAIVQGIASPALTSLVYMVLPIIFRRLSMKAGDMTKTGRERHVVAKLYSFFVFNNLFVFSLFSALWSFAGRVISDTMDSEDKNAWRAILNANFGTTVLIALCNISPFWVSWLIQRQLGAAIDLSQLWKLIYGSIMRKFSNPTPRELIELSAPPPFDYASYYNYFLFYATAALCYAPIMPLVLPAAGVYFAIDVALKKYLLMYVFVTKTESGGMFWRILFNRVLFGLMLSHLVVFLVVWVRNGDHTLAYSVAPLPFLMIIFKLICSRLYDNKITYYSTRIIKHDNAEEGFGLKEQGLKNDRLASRFGHPALYKPLITPMVHAKAQNILASIYQGRLSDGRDAGPGDSMSVSGYSDTYALDSMASGKVGKVSSAVPGFEVVPESRLDFEFYKNRDEFAADHGAGELFGQASDIVRPDTPGTVATGSDNNSRPGTPVGGMGFGNNRRLFSNQSDMGNTAYGGGYMSPSQQYSYNNQAPYSPPTLTPGEAPGRGRSPLYHMGDNGNDSSSNLVYNAAGMPTSTPAGLDVSDAGLHHEQSFDSSRSRGPLGGFSIPNPRAPGVLGASRYGYGNVPQTDDDMVQTPPSAMQGPPFQPNQGQNDPMQYDYFRGNRRQGPGPGAPSRGANGSVSGNSFWGGN
ncbi:hypothetical protein SMACR_08580 [Sordaria macrospora]|uniref:Uncharacterized protein n=1 Tax=Sordaria macrospora TaxID=5147 RepID=A0A8S8ZX15_SORMA|nr:hypothetical protein SMACR_08580 [Sordaria macrospora]WPJ62459.1 hypothetical protein SMAC4_08580 [Sordaria macrospora]